jgi:PadR family transcriptional regulator PadR
MWERAAFEARGGGYEYPQRLSATLYSTRSHMCDTYIYRSYMPERDLRKGSAEVLILALLEDCDRHGYEIAKLIDERSGGAIKFHVASLYPTLYRLERRGLILGRWVEKAGKRRRRFYRLTAAGQKTLGSERRSWTAFFAALNRVAGINHA